MIIHATYTQSQNAQILHAAIVVFSKHDRISLVLPLPDIFSFPGIIYSPLLPRITIHKIEGKTPRTVENNIMG